MLHTFKAATELYKFKKKISYTSYKVFTDMFMYHLLDEQYNHQQHYMFALLAHTIWTFYVE